MIRGALPESADTFEWVREDVEDPVGGRFVLPESRCGEITDDRRRPGAAHLLRGVNGPRQAEHPVTAPHEYLQQFSAKKPVGSRDKGGGSCAGFHAGSVDWPPAGQQRQGLYSTPTGLAHRDDGRAPRTFLRRAHTARVRSSRTAC